MMYSIMPSEMIEKRDFWAEPPENSSYKGVPITCKKNVICDVLSTDPADYLKLPIAGRL